MLAIMHKTYYELLPFDECNKFIFAHSLTANNFLTKHNYTNAHLPPERPDFSDSFDMRNSKCSKALFMYLYHLTDDILNYYFLFQK